MNFSEAYKAMKEADKKIKLPEWNGYWYYSKPLERFYCVNLSMNRVIEIPDSYVHSYFHVPNDNWVIAQPKRSERLYTFQDAVGLMKMDTNLIFIIKSNFPLFRKTIYAGTEIVSELKVFYYKYKSELCCTCYYFDKRGKLIDSLDYHPYKIETKEFQAEDYKNIGTIEDLENPEGLYERLLVQEDR